MSLGQLFSSLPTAIVAFSSLISVRFLYFFTSYNQLNLAIFQRIDEMAEIVCTLCGEATFQGYESLHQDYLDREERNVGASLGFADH